MLSKAARGWAAPRCPLASRQSVSYAASGTIGQHVSAAALPMR
jgi:hypothetical protein